MALTAGLSTPCVQRLSKTWDRIEDTKIKVLQHICDPQGNFSNYRVILKMFEAEGNTPVLIPIFSIFLKDCYFRLKPCMNPGDLAADQQLKCWKELTGPIADFDHWRSKRIQFTKRERLITYMSSYQALNETGKLEKHEFDKLFLKPEKKTFFRTFRSLVLNPKSDKFFRKVSAPPLPLFEKRTLDGLN